MTDTTDSTPAETPDEGTPETSTPEGVISDDTPEGPDLESDRDPDTFPREVVEDLRKENGRYRQRAQKADDYAKRLHTELVRATGKLADPSDLPFDEEHLADPERMSAAVDDLLARKPHLATRKPAGDIGQGGRGSGDAPLGLLDLLKMHT
ncbi:hypothetical protein QYF68_09965 [Mycolicibacterium austroafricanum]|uniref:Uncharacterized protein n=1 Tax=Mycolicibacterium austroafricanum TaxID=39687 RepID=A0ABT8HC76_MYCAO|nr:hypothetical protein [Mycolicibacterium austroafricanum]MDN4518150.1 hypothetical protein [Mycolicibacterium austroafricanum]